MTAPTIPAIITTSWAITCPRCEGKAWHDEQVMGTTRSVHEHCENCTWLNVYVSPTKEG